MRTECWREGRAQQQTPWEPGWGGQGWVTGGKGLAGSESCRGLWVGSGLLGRHWGLTAGGAAPALSRGTPRGGLRKQTRRWLRQSCRGCLCSARVGWPEVMNVNPGSWPVTAHSRCSPRHKLLGDPTFQLRMLLGVPETLYWWSQVWSLKKCTSQVPGAACGRGGGQWESWGSQWETKHTIECKHKQTRESSQLCNKYCKAHLVSFFFFSSQI